MSDAIRTYGLTKTYGTTQAVADLSLEVGSGQVFAFLGPNGAGKSTTIRMLLSLQRPTSGTARIFGLDVERDAVDIHRRIGYLPGDLALYPRMTGQRHIDWFSRARSGVDTSFVSQLVKRFDVVLDRPVRELSKGNRQKIGLILAVMHRPDLLVLDEPTSGLDPLMQHEFERLVQETVAEGKTVFLSSHELNEVQRLADRVAIVKAGRLLVTDTVAGLARSVPRRMELRFTAPVDSSIFVALDGVRVVEADGTRLTLDVTGPVAPILRVIAEREPVDLVSRPANLDELFLNFYRDPATGEHGDAH